MGYVGIKGRLNFLQIQCFSGKCEQYFMLSYHSKEIKIDNSTVYIFFSTDTEMVKTKTLAYYRPSISIEKSRQLSQRMLKRTNECNEFLKINIFT